MLTSEVAVVKSHHGISVKCTRYRDTGPTDPSLLSRGLLGGGEKTGEMSILFMCSLGMW